MSEPVTIKPVKHPRYTHRASYTQGGQYLQRYFPSKKAALEFAKDKRIELLNEGRRHGEVTEAERRAVILSRELAEQYAGQGVKDFTIEAALRHYAAHLDARRVSVPVLAAYDQFHAAKVAEKASHRYLQDITGRVQQFAKAHKSMLATEITKDDVRRYLNRLKVAPVTMTNHHRLISVFLSWCVDRGYATANSAEGWKAPAAPAEEPGILSVKQAAALLNAAAPEIVPALAVSLFAGLRAAEVERLDWSNVDFDHGCIIVSARSAKTRRRRVVAMPSNLAQWLAPYRRESGPVRPSPQIWRDRLEAARSAAGIAEWPHNAARHSCASYAYDLHQNAAFVAAQLGHDAAVLETHYKGLVKPGEGAAYFAITPDTAAQPDNVIAFTAPPATTAPRKRRKQA